MFEYVKDREVEAKKRMTLYSALFIAAIIAILAAIAFTYL